MTWIWLYDIDYTWKTKREYSLLNNVRTPLYYASALGLESVVGTLVAAEAKDTIITGTVNARGGRLGNTLEAVSYGGYN